MEFLPFWQLYIPHNDFNIQMKIKKSLNLKFPVVRQYHVYFSNADESVIIIKIILKKG